MQQSKITLLVIGILAVMFLLMAASAWDESAIIDELAHIPAGFGYVLAQDYRLNPEHPPIIKTLAALSGQLFARPHFPFDAPAWRDEINGQWTQGAIFLYESGNNADQIIFWSRVPLMLLAAIFGLVLFWWTRKRFGTDTALLTTIFYAFSPTFLTHSRYVTTDLGAAVGFFLGIAGFLYFLEQQTRKRAALAGVAFGVAQLFKFSLVLLLPVYVVLGVAWIVTRPNLHVHERLRALGRMTAQSAVLLAVGIFIIWAVFLVHIKNYPVERQLRDAELLLSSHPIRPAVALNLALIKNPVTRPVGQYLLGVLMVNQRATGGNTTYFLGDVAATGSPLYFPLLYLLKEPLALHILTAIALLHAIKKTWKRRGSYKEKTYQHVAAWIETHFVEFSALVFIVFYWLLSILSPLNIGIRHVLPTFPFIYILVSKQIAAWLGAHSESNPRTWRAWLQNVYELYIKAIPKYVVVAFLLLWFVASSVSAFPNFMTYYNELGGGERNGYTIAVDSNYDWGQDLRRLRAYVEKNNIERIGIDYFGGGHVEYYFGSRAFRWNSSQGPLRGWFAISATLRQGAFGNPVKGFKRTPQESYGWLRPYVPVAQIGSMFVYQLP